VSTPDTPATPAKQIAAPSAGYPGARALASDQAHLPKRGEKPYWPTLFDRLCDDAPSEKVEAPEAYTKSHSQMRQIIQRDLELLLNTTNQSDWIDHKRYPQAAASTINYGVPSLAGGHLTEKKWVDLENLIRTAIENFEPRLIPETLIVRPLIKEQRKANYNVLTFEISGHIRMQPYPLEFTVQSNVDLETNRIDLQYMRSQTT
jgi:type VI secretion system protein ImpF